jgi:hypothetical protein
MGQVGVFYSYSQWERMNQEARVGYIVGAFDTLQTVAADDFARKLSIYRHNCMTRAAMTGIQLQNNVIDLR